VLNKHINLFLFYALNRDFSFFAYSSNGLYGSFFYPTAGAV
jgi:hypothetical protein